MLGSGRFDHLIHVRNNGGVTPLEAARMRTSGETSIAEKFEEAQERVRRRQREEDKEEEKTPSEAGGKYVGPA